MAAARSNRDQHFAVVVTDEAGAVVDTFHERCRDTLGGWAHLMERVADRLGVSRMLGLRAVNAAGTAWTVTDGHVAGWRAADGRVVRFTAVEVL